MFRLPSNRSGARDAFIELSARDLVSTGVLNHLLPPTDANE